METDLEQFAEEFAAQIDTLLGQVIPGELPPVQAFIARGETNENFVVRPGDGPPTKIELNPGASLAFKYEWCLDSHNQFPAVELSEFHLVSARTNRPIVRCEYVREMRKPPTSHWHVHGESTALGHVAAQGLRPGVTLQDLHIPTGGPRFRPCLEDFLQFVIDECKLFRPLDGWTEAVEVSREGWRRLQVAAATRDAPDEAANVLRRLGYVVEPPDNRRDDSVKTLRRF